MPSDRMTPISLRYSMMLVYIDELSEKNATVIDSAVMM